MRAACPTLRAGRKKAVPATTVEVGEGEEERGAGRTRTGTLGHDELE